MSKFASGKNSYAISDRSGFRYRYRDMRKEWNGALVGKDEFEPKQPQLGPFRKVIDAQALREARPDIASGLSVFVGIPLVEIPNPRPLVAFGKVGSVNVTTNESVISFSVTGVSATASVGSAEVTAQAVSVPTSGLTATGGTGTVTIPNESVSLTGASATGSVGSVAAAGDILASVTGLSITGAVGTTTIAAGATAPTSITGLTGSVGSVSVSLDVTITLTGLSATGNVGTATVFTGTWALASGSWSDSGVWSDSSYWNDGS